MEILAKQEGKASRKYWYENFRTWESESYTLRKQTESFALLLRRLRERQLPPTVSGFPSTVLLNSARSLIW